MFGFLRKKIDSAGSVLFRGSLPPRVENLDLLRDMGVVLEPRHASAEYVWAAHARHPQWGDAELCCPRQTPVPPREWVELDARLTDAEVSAIASCGSSVQVVMRHERQNVLGTRKLALRLMRAVMGEYGVSVFDHGSHRFWSRAALDEELAHNADLDIESLFVLHAVGNERDDATVGWLHSHGLAELGFFDFDILEPSSDVMDGASDLTRAIAFRIVEGLIQANSNDIAIAEPGGDIRMVPADVFQRRAAGRFVALREDPEGQHSTNRSVVCEPVKGLWSRLLGARIEPSRWLRGPIDDNIVIGFSKEATDLMAQRARGSYLLCRQYAEEFAEFEVKVLVKLGLPTDSGLEADCEHLWFEATKLDESRVTGTLLNEPWDIAALQPRRSYTYGLDVLTDWAVFTPAGRITPVEAVAAGRLRDNRDAILEAMRASDPS